MLGTKKRGLTRFATMAGVAAIGTIGVGGVAFASGGHATPTKATVRVAAPNATGGVTGAVGSVDESTQGTIYENNHKNTSTSTHLFNLKLPDGTNLLAYCIQFNTDFTDSIKYNEGTWDSSNVKNLNKVQWVLQHGYPSESAAALAKEAGVSGTVSVKQAVEATQAAVWNFSDGETLNTSNTKNARSVVKIYNYLTGSANSGGTEPSPSLSITPTSLTATLKAGATAGQLVGPFTVNTNASTASLALGNTAPSGLTLTNAQGAPVTSASNGDQVYFDVPTSSQTGAASFTASAKATIEGGRVFESGTSPSKYQKLILATSSPVQVSAMANATWSTATPTPTPTPSTTPTPTPTPSTTPSMTPTPSPTTTTPGAVLAHTGASNTPMIAGIVIALIVIGGGLLAFVKLRGRNAGTPSGS